MAVDKKYYWLKLKKDFFKRHDIQIIESMPNGKDYLLFYLKLLVESVDHDGNLRFNDTIPYNENMLSTITNTNVDTVRSAMKMFVELKMIEVLADETIYMNEIQKMLGTETYWAEQKRKQKQNKLIEQKQYQHIEILSYERLLLPNGKVQYVDNKRYGGNAFDAFERAEGKCQLCGTYDNLCIHHMNEYSNDMKDLVVLCRKCHRTGDVNKIPPTEFGNFPPNVLPESNVSNLELDIEIDIDKEIDISSQKLKFTDEQMDIAQLLLSMIKDNNPNYVMRGNLNTWADEVRLMVERDKIDINLIRETVIWCQKDSFWQSNILSTKKLREKFNQLIAKMGGSRFGENKQSAGKVKAENKYAAAKSSKFFS